MVGALQTTMAALRAHRCVLLQTPRGQMREKVLMSAMASVAITAGLGTQVAALSLDNLAYFNKQETFRAYLASDGAAIFTNRPNCAHAHDTYAAIVAGNPRLVWKWTTQNKVNLGDGLKMLIVDEIDELLHDHLENLIRLVKPLDLTKIRVVFLCSRISSSGRHFAEALVDGIDIHEVHLYKNREIRDTRLDFIVPSEERFDTLARMVATVTKAEERFQVLVVCNNTEHCVPAHARIDQKMEKAVAMLTEEMASKKRVHIENALSERRVVVSSLNYARQNASKFARQFVLFYGPPINANNDVKEFADLLDIDTFIQLRNLGSTTVVLVNPGDEVDVATAFRQSIPRMIPKSLTMDEFQAEIDSLVQVQNLVKSELVKMDSKLITTASTA